MMNYNYLLKTLNNFFRRVVIIRGAIKLILPLEAIRRIKGEFPKG